MQLPLPADARNIQYKKLVEHISFESNLSVKELAQEFSAKLDEQGWKDQKGGLIGQKNAILKKEQGIAKLTIMIKPIADGSEVKIFTEALNWDGVEKAAKKSTKNEGDKTVDEIEKEAQDLIDKTLKGVSKDVSSDLLKDIFNDAKDDDDDDE